MKRTPILMGLAFVISASPALAQQDGEWTIRNEDVHAVGNATDGTCEPATFPLEFDIHLGPGNRAETAQGDQRTVGTFDPETGTIKTSKGKSSKVLKPDGRTNLKGSYSYENCRWDLALELNKPAFAFVEVEAPAEPAASPAAVHQADAPVGTLGADTQKSEGVPFYIFPTAAIVAGGATVFLWRFRHRTPSVQSFDSVQEALAEMPPPARTTSRVRLDNGDPSQPEPEVVKSTTSNAPHASGTEDPFGSWWRCENCGHVGRYSQFLRHGNEGVCPDCGDPDHSESLPEEEQDEMTAKQLESTAKQLGDVLGAPPTSAQGTPETPSGAE